MERVKPSYSLKHLNLLYVEDEKDIREPFIFMLKKYVKKIFIASNGKEGLDIFKNEKIEIVVSDIKMPVMNGLDMAEEIKLLDPETPIIFTTAFDDADYLSRAIEIGVDAYITKPIDRNKLFTKLNFIADAIYTKKEINQYLNLIEILFNYQKNALLLIDENLNIKLFNKSFSDICKSVGIESFKSLDNTILSCEDESGNKLDKLYFNKIIKNNNTIVLRKKINEQNIKYFELKITTIGNNTIIAINDITAYILEKENIKETAMLDQLTGIYNRKKFELLEKRLIGKKVCFIIFDIDNFKMINDTYGHFKGDEVLKKLAETVKNNLRGTDIVIRWGGEEFLIVLQNLEDTKIAIKLAEKLRTIINNIDFPEIGRISCSFGVSCKFISSKEDISYALDCADKALYLAKRTGKNKVCSG